MVSATELIGHRGARGLFPENSLPGFIEAIKLGVDGIEMDVVISADGQVVVSHDMYINRDICRKGDQSEISLEEQAELKIYQLTYQQIQTFDCGTVFNPEFPNQVLMPVAKPLLSDVLKQTYPLKHDLKYYVEIKSHPQDYDVYQPQPEEVVRRVYDVLEENVPLENIVIISFDHNILRTFHARYPNMNFGVLTMGHEAIDNILDDLGFIPAYYGPRYDEIDQLKIETIHKLKMKVMVWTVDELDNFRHQAKLGVDGVVTDYPDFRFN